MEYAQLLFSALGSPSGSAGFLSYFAAYSSPTRSRARSGPTSSRRHGIGSRGWRVFPQIEAADLPGILPLQIKESLLETQVSFAVAWTVEVAGLIDAQHVYFRGSLTFCDRFFQSRFLHFWMVGENGIHRQEENYGSDAVTVNVYALRGSGSAA